MAKKTEPLVHTCRTCRDYRPGAPEAPGYEGCAWCRTPVLPGVEMPVTRWVGAVRCVRADQADLERGCAEWREDVDPFAREFKTSPERRAQIARSLAKHRGHALDPVWVCPYCGTKWPAVNVHGEKRQACGVPACAAKFRGDRPKRQWFRIDVQIVSAMRQAQATERCGYAVLGARFGVSTSQARRIILGVSRAQGGGGE